LEPVHEGWTTVIRVVSGEFGGRRLVVPDGLATRPTTDKVRQAVFNSLDSAGLIDGAAVADLFAGSGALGIEALSRGAASCVFVERDRAALQALRTNIAALGLAQRTTVVTSDVPAWVPALRGIDLAMIDPPYEFDGWERLLTLLQVPYVVAESGQEIEPATGWQTVKSRRYGRTWVTQLERVA
jgi:16S rRNA (guanine966-N2)-methyltransferase